MWNVLFLNSSLNITAIVNPVSIASIIALVILTIPISIPKTLMVKNIAAMLIAGPANKNVIAGPSPAPFLLILANKGNIVQEHTASKIPDVDATKYDFILDTLSPKYFSISSCLIKLVNPPAMNNAGNKHVSTCSLAYSFNNVKELCKLVVNHPAFTGKKNINPNIVMYRSNLLDSFILLIVLSLPFFLFLNFLSLHLRLRQVLMLLRN